MIVFDTQSIRKQVNSNEDVVKQGKTARILIFNKKIRNWRDFF